MSINMQRQQPTMRAQQGAPVPQSAMSGPSAPPMGSYPAPMQQPFNSMPGAPPSQYGPPAQQQYGSQPPQQYGSQPPQYGSQPPMQQYGSQPSQYGSQQRPPMQQQYGQPPQQQYGQPPMQPYGQPPMQQSFGNPPMGQRYGVPAGGPVAGGSVSLAKGGNTSLSKIAPNLTQAKIGLGWDVRQTGGPAFDLDAACFMLKGDGRVRTPQDFIFYNNKQSVDGSVFHHGDNLTGVGEGDDEVISIELMRVPMDVQKIVFTCSIYEAELRQQNFGMVSRAFIRVTDGSTGQEICRYDLSEEASMSNCMIFGEVYRYNNEWKFRAVGQSFQGGLRTMGNMFGIALQ